MIRPIRCVVVECDECRGVLDDEDAGYTCHFDDDDQALTYLVQQEWTVTQDGHLRCRLCTARLACHHRDHEWDVWRVCECRGTIPAHDTNGCGLYRTCARCGAFDDTTLALLPTTDQPQGGR